MVIITENAYETTAVTYPFDKVILESTGQIGNGVSRSSTYSNEAFRVGYKNYMKTFTTVYSHCKGTSVRNNPCLIRC